LSLRDHSTIPQSPVTVIVVIRERQQCLLAPAARHSCDQEDDSILESEDKCAEVASIASQVCSDGRIVTCTHVDVIVSHGCPVDDGESIDTYDQCVTGFVDAIEDDDACTDVLVGTIEGIQFRTGEALIRVRSGPLLAAVARVLIEYPSLRVRVHGRTNDSSDDDHLSIKRADAVRDHLVAHYGIDFDRFETVSSFTVAEYKPNWKKNLLIEFEILR